MVISWTKTALEQFRKAATHSRIEFGDKVAENFKAGVFETIQVLAEHPQKGTIEPLLRHKKFEYRFVMYLRYKILYRVMNHKVLIIRFFHTSQNPDKLIF